jgi:hypothetical protein
MKRKLRVILVAGAIALAASGAHAQLPSFDDWAIGIGDDGEGAYAATMNDSGSVFGQTCSFDGSCEYRLITSTACEPDATYPGLVTTQAGAASVTLVCRGSVDKGKHLLAVAPFDDVDALARRATGLGIAIPTTGDRFHAMHFSLRGATDAVDFMREAVARHIAAGTPAAARRVGTRRDVLL